MRRRSRTGPTVYCFQGQTNGRGTASRLASPPTPGGTHDALEEIVNCGPLPTAAATAHTPGACLLAADLEAAQWQVSAGGRANSGTNGNGSNGSNGSIAAAAPLAVQLQPDEHAEGQGSMPAGPSTSPVAAAAAAQAEPLAPPAEPYTLQKKVALAGGVLDLVHLEGSRLLRIWMPPGERLQSPQGSLGLTLGLTQRTLAAVRSAGCAVPRALLWFARLGTPPRSTDRDTTL